MSAPVMRRKAATLGAALTLVTALALAADSPPPPHPCATAVDDDAGDTVQSSFVAAQADGWKVRLTGGVGSTRVFATSSAGNYSDDACMTLESGVIPLGAAPALTFQSKWDTEPSWDGGIVEIATEAGGFTNWVKLDNISYPGAMLGEPTLTTACSNPGLEDGELAFTGTSSGAFQSFSSDLSAWANTSVKLRYVFGSDGASNAAGWFIDNIHVGPIRAPASCAINVAPEASAGPDAEVVEGETAELSAADTYEPNNDPVSYVWDQIAGTPSVTLSGEETATPSFSTSVCKDSELTFRVTARDSQGLEDTDEVTITVRNINELPTADAGDDSSIEEGRSTVLSAAGSRDADCEDLTYSWVQIYGPSVTLSSSSARAVSFAAPSVSADSVLRFRLTVIDAAGARSSDDVDVLVRNVATDAENQPVIGESQAGTMAPAHLLLFVLAGLLGGLRDRRGLRRISHPNRASSR